MAAPPSLVTDTRPPEVSKDAAVHFFSTLDRDRDLYITEDDMHWFVTKMRLSLKPPVLTSMFKEATTSTSPAGKLRLVDVRQAVGFRRERQRLDDVPADAASGQRAAVKWVYRSRPNRRHWVFLISTATGDSSIFVPPLFPTPPAHSPTAAQSPTNRPPSRSSRGRSTTIVRDFDAGVAVARNFMIHGTRDGAEDRMATIAASVASVGASTKAGVLRRQAMETTMNRMLTGADDDLWRGGTPTPTPTPNTPTPASPTPMGSTPKSFTFDATKSFADAHAQLEVDSVGEQIRLVADRTAEYRARASTPLAELGSDRLTVMPSAKLAATKRRMVKEASVSGEFVVAPIPQSRVPVTLTSELTRRPLRRTVAGNTVDGGSSSDDEDPDADSDDDAVPADAVATATNMFRGTRALSPGGLSDWGLFGGGGGDDDTTVMTMSLPGSPVGGGGGGGGGSSSSLFGSKSSLFPPGSVKSGSARSGVGGRSSGAGSPLTLSTVFAKSRSVTGTVPGLEGSRDQALSMQTSKSAIMLGGSRNRHTAKRITKLVQRRANTLTKNMRRMGKPGGVAAVKAGLDPTTASGNAAPAIAVSDHDTAWSGRRRRPFQVTAKQTSRNELLRQEALQRREGTDKWKPHQGPSFRPKYVPPVNKEFDDPFGLLSRLLTNKERVAELDAIKREGIANYRGPDVRCADLALKKDRPPEFHKTYSHPKPKPWEMPRPATTDGTVTTRHRTA